MTRFLLLLAVLAVAPAVAQTGPGPSRTGAPAAGALAPADTQTTRTIEVVPVDVVPVGAADRTADDGVTDGPLGAGGLVLVIGALLLASLIGIAALVTNRKRAAFLVRAPAQPLNQPAPMPRSQAAAAARPVPEAFATKAEHEALVTRVARIEQRMFDGPRVAAPPVHVQAPPSAPAPPPSAAAGVASSFASWCRVGGGLVDRHELFQSHLGTTLPDAAVEVVRRDLDSPARPVAFDAVGGNSAAAYWLVRAGGELLLFPQPQSPQQFRDLAPVFAGSAAPQTLTSVEPARVSASGGGYVLTNPGRIA